MDPGWDPTAGFFSGLIVAGTVYIWCTKRSGPFRSLEVYVSAKFPRDGKRGTSELIHVAFVGKVKVVKHDLYFGLDICRRSWLRNFVFRIRDSCLRFMDATCKFLGLGQGTDPLYICLNHQLVGHYCSSVTNWASPV